MAFVTSATPEAESRQRDGLAADPSTGTHRRRRSRARPGVSLLAQGELWIWITGGALLMALAMIVGLLLIVVWHGGRAFWPGPLVQVELHDGTKVLGEIAREEEFPLNDEAVSRLSGPAAETAREQLARTGTVPVRRRLFRTGNFELTQSHYRWISDLEIRSDSEAMPAWGVVVERLEWGRFYGTPAAFHQHFVRSPGLEEEDTAAILRLLSDHGAALPAEQQEAVTAAQESVTRELMNLRRLNTRRSLETAQAEAENLRSGPTESKASSPSAWQAVLADATRVSIDELADDAEVVEFVAQWDDTDEAWKLLQMRQGLAWEARRERVSLERHDMGLVNQDIESARLAVRAEELHTGVAVVDLLDELHNLRGQIAVADDEIDAWQSRLERVGRRSVTRADVLKLARQAFDAWREQSTAELAESRQRVAEIEASLVNLPEKLRSSAESYLQVQRSMVERARTLQARITQLRTDGSRFQLQVAAADGQEVAIPLDQVVRAYRPNELSGAAATKLYADRWWEFLSDEPREANSEGGIFPALVGTVTMTLVMSLAVVPFGVLAALYLREYARGGFIVSAVRIAINNLAGVPSIVFGVFGLGFFCYLVGAFIDGGPAQLGIVPWPPARWYLALGVLAVVAVVAFGSGLTAVSHADRHHRLAWLGKLSLLLWVVATGLLIILITKSPFFDGFFAARLPNPTVGKGGLLWSSLTLALLTLPVVIVATEEALSAVPNSLREGSYACGAGKWQTIRRIILPQAMPGILTGMILAMARGAGEVAPLMLVGAVKLAPELPVDTAFPFVHPERSFMHLGFHIYDLGFQSQNSEAAKPMVFTTTLLLILMIFVLNVSAIWLRSQLRKRYRTAQF